MGMRWAEGNGLGGTNCRCDFSFFGRWAQSGCGCQGSDDSFVTVVVIEQGVILSAVQEGEGMIGQGDVRLKIRHEDDSHHAATSGTA